MLKLRHPPGPGRYKITVKDRLFAPNTHPPGYEHAGPFFFFVNETYHYSKGHFLLWTRDLATWFQMRIGVQVVMDIGMGGRIETLETRRT